MSRGDEKYAVRRKSPRVVGPFTARWLGAVTVPLVVHDLSVGGCLILGSAKMLPNGRITLEIDLPDRSCVQVMAEPVGLRGKGFALKFVQVAPGTVLQLQRSIDELLQRQSK